MQCVSGSRQGRGQSDHWLLRLATGTWNISSLVGKEPEVAREVEIPKKKQSNNDISGKKR